MDTKPAKAAKLLQSCIKILRKDHIGLPVYNHLLEIYAEALLRDRQFQEAELQYKNCIEHSVNKLLYDPEYRVSFCTS